MIEYLGYLWCRLFHDHITRPAHGEYTCLVCLRKFGCNWEDEEEKAA